MFMAIKFLIGQLGFNWRIKIFIFLLEQIFKLERKKIAKEFELIKD